MSAYQYDLTAEGIAAKAAELTARMGWHAAAHKALDYSRLSSEGSDGRRFWLTVMESIEDCWTEPCHSCGGADPIGHTAGCAEIG